MSIADVDASASASGRALRLSRVSLAILVTWAVACVVLVCVTVNPLWPRIGIFGGSADFLVYRDAAHHILQGWQLYDDKLFDDLWWTYTPFAALLFVPLDFLPSGAGQYIWMALNLVLLVAVVVRCWQLLGYAVTRYLVGISTVIALGCVFLEPVRTTLFYGQINVVLMLLLLWDFSRSTDDTRKGVATGIAAGIKLTPGYFAIFYLALGQRRAAAVAGIAALGTMIVGIVVLPRDSWQYWTGDFFDSSRVDDELDHPANQSLRGMMAKVTDHAPGFWLWALLAIAIAAVSMWIAVRLYRRDERLLSITLVGMSGAVVSPYSWSHHWMWFVPVIVYFIHRALTDPRWWVAVVGLSGIIGSWAYKYRFEDEPRVGLYLFPPRWIDVDVLENLYVVMFVPFLVWFAWVSFRPERRSVATREVA